MNLVLILVFFFTTKKRFSQNKYEKNITNEVERLIVKIQRQTETCITLLEDKITQANKIVKEAENRIQILNKELGSKENEIIVLDKLMSENKSSQNIKMHQDATATQTEPISPTGKKAEEIVIYSNNPTATQKKLSNNYVLDLHKEGVAAPEISKKTGIPLGEVNLIISLSGN